MRLLVMSDPDAKISQSLHDAGIDSLLCVTPDNVHLCTEDGRRVSGREIKCPQAITIDIVALKSELLKAYPLMDRWISSKMPISTIVSTLLIYTISLVRIIANYPPYAAILETGAPHHLFSYCLDVALRYLSIKTYYVYGNGIDERCLIVSESDKSETVSINDYDGSQAIDQFLAAIRANQNYKATYTVQALSNLKNRSLIYASTLHLKASAEKLLKKIIFSRRNYNTTKIRLSFGGVGLYEGFSIILRHQWYLKRISKFNFFDINTIYSDDIIYVGHMVPEATSFPESPDYPDELDVLLDLKCRFPNSKIFYREHPAINLYSQDGVVHYQGLHKNYEFYEHLTGLNIPIIPASCNMERVRQKNCIFATKTGSVALENSALGIITILYGYPFYGTDLPYAVPIRLIPMKASIEIIRDISNGLLKESEGLPTYLKKRFSGTIVNPGIGIGKTYPHLRDEFDKDLVRLAKKIEFINQEKQRQLMLGA
jgi:hypothetical protein